MAIKPIFRRLWNFFVPKGIVQRVAISMVAMVAVILTVTGAVVVLVESSAWREEADQSLTRVASELRVFAETGVDPKTGKKFTNPTDMLETFLARTVISDQEGEVGFVNGKVAWIGYGQTPVRPEKDKNLINHVRELTTEQNTVLGTFKSDQHEYRYIVVPIHFSTGESGALLHVYLTDAIQARVGELIKIFGIVGVCAILLTVAISGLVVGRVLRPIEQLRETAEEITEHDLSRRVPVLGEDDLARLTTTINSMLDRLEFSVSNQRQLLDDVGHELRTPITIVRGHLELMDVNDPDDTTETRDLAIDELDRMSYLVRDLLVLAKAEQPDFVILEPTQIAALTDQIFEKAQALGQRTWVLENIADIQASVDSSRLTQAILQLVANAVKYSSPGSKISLGSTVKNNYLYFTVTDNGIGISPEDQGQLFTRFKRGTNVAEVEGAGLGLTIVQTIVSAHAGNLTVESKLGEGSTFTIGIPVVDENDRG